MLKKYLALTLLIAVGLTLSGLQCGAKKTTTSGLAEITVWRLFDSQDTFAPLIKQFEKDNKNVKIKYVMKDPEEYELDSLNALAAGAGPDVWSIPNDWVARHSDKLVTAPAGILAASSKEKKTDVELYQDAFVPVAAQDNIIDDKIYGIPLSVDTLAVYYNKDIFKQVLKDLDNQKLSRAERQLREKLLDGNVGSWDEFIQLVKILTSRSGADIKQSAVAMGTAANISFSQDILYLLMLQNNTQMVTPDKKSAGFNLPTKKETGEQIYPGATALDFYTSFANPGKETYTWNNSLPNSIDAFTAGQTAMIFGYSFTENLIKQKAPTMNVRKFAMPQIKGVANAVDFGQYYTETVTKSSKYPDVAWAFVRFAATEGIGDYLGTTSKPTALKKQTKQIGVNERGEQKNPFVFQVGTATDWYKGKYPVKTDKVFRDLIDDIIVRGNPLQRAMDTAAKLETDLLMKAPY